MKDQHGQMVVEAVLLMTVLLALTMMVTKAFKDNQFAQKLTSEPWTNLAGMIECGSWKSCKGSGVHPSTADRGLSLKPEGQL